MLKDLGMTFLQLFVGWIYVGTIGLVTWGLLSISNDAPVTFADVALSTALFLGPLFIGRIVLLEFKVGEK